MFICKHGQSNTVDEVFNSKALRSAVYKFKANDAQAIGRLAEFTEYVQSESWPGPLAVIVNKDGSKISCGVDFGPDGKVNTALAKF